MSGKVGTDDTMDTAAVTPTDGATWTTRPIAPASYSFEAIPAGERTLTACWLRALEAHPDRTFLSFDGGEALTYAEIDAVVRRWRCALRGVGLHDGDRVAVMLPNGLDAFALLLATVAEAMVAVPLNPDFRGEVLRHVLSDSSSAALVARAESVRNVDPAWSLSALTDIVVLDADPATVSERRTQRCHAPDSLSTKGELPDNRPSPVDTAAILYTSGTTGKSKGVVLPHEYFVFYAWSFAHGMGHHSDDVVFTPLPMFHANALVVTIFPALLVGARCAVYSGFSASRFWQQISDSGATHFAGMGVVGSILMRRPEEEFVPGHRLRHCHLVPAPDEVAEFERRFGVPVYYSTYGLTEGQVVLPSRDGSHRPGLIGRFHPYHDVRVVDAQDREVETGTTGEMVARPLIPNIMFEGYLNRAEATVEAWHNLWFHTGDLVSRDGHGDLWFRGRAKDSIRRRGENVSAFEVEREVAAFPGVAEAAAVGVPADLGEEEIMVVVVARAGFAVAPAALHRHCEDRLPGFMVPRYIDVRAELPRNASHKVSKPHLRDAGVHQSVWDARA